jgi:hypothetical protein
MQIIIHSKITTITTVILKTKSKTQNKQPKTPSPFDPQNPYKEPQSGPKDIAGKDIEKDLIENDPLRGLKRICIPKRAMRLKAQPLRP